jgi:alpha-1,3-fucosyltransferase
VLFNWEAPHYSPLKKLLPVINEINWVMSYRYDSDIYVPYGRVVKCNNNWNISKNILNNKIGIISWMVSNCHTPSKRENYVRELNNYVDVDIFGNCGTVICKHYNKSCFESLTKKYMFYLSFENSVITL